LNHLARLQATHLSARNKLVADQIERKLVGRTIHSSSRRPCLTPHDLQQFAEPLASVEIDMQGCKQTRLVTNR